MFLSAGLVLLGLFIIFSRLLFASGRKKQKEYTKQVVDIKPDAVADISEGSQVPSEPAKGLEEFTRFRIHSFGEVVLRQGDSPSFKIEGEPAIKEKISAIVSNDVLSIQMESDDVLHAVDFGWVDDEKLIRTTVIVKALTQLDLGGTTSLHADNLQGTNLKITQSDAATLTIRGLAYESIEVNHQGAGLIHLEGEVQQLTLRLGGEGGFDGRNLRSQDVDISLSGRGQPAYGLKKR